MRWPWQVYREYRQRHRQAAVNAALLKLPEVQEAIARAYERYWIQMGAVLNARPSTRLMTGLREDA